MLHVNVQHTRPGEGKRWLVGPEQQQMEGVFEGAKKYIYRGMLEVSCNSDMSLQPHNNELIKISLKTLKQWMKSSYFMTYQQLIDDD